MTATREAGVIDQARRAQLLNDGFCMFPGLMPAEMIARLRAATDRIFNALTPEQKRATANQGSTFALEYQDPVFVEMITWPAAIAALRTLGFDRPRYWSGYPIAREPHSGPLYWHQDWPYWDEPEAMSEAPHQVFLMWYLTDTTFANGCLRVIPGSHRKRHLVHDAILNGHDGDVRTITDPEHPAYRNYPDQVDVPVKAGDLLIGDARVLHASHANTTENRRTVITLWYCPRYDEASDRMKAAWQRGLMVKPPADMQADHAAALRPLLFDYTGGEAPARWNRVPMWK